MIHRESWYLETSLEEELKRAWDRYEHTPQDYAPETQAALIDIIRLLRRHGIKTSKPQVKDAYTRVRKEMIKILDGALSDALRDVEDVYVSVSWKGRGVVYVGHSTFSPMVFFWFRPKPEEVDEVNGLAYLFFYGKEWADRYPEIDYDDRYGGIDYVNVDQAMKMTWEYLRDHGLLRHSTPSP